MIIFLKYSLMLHRCKYFLLSKRLKFYSSVSPQHLSSRHSVQQSTSQVNTTYIRSFVLFKSLIMYLYIKVGWWLLVKSLPKFIKRSSRIINLSSFFDFRVGLFSSVLSVLNRKSSQLRSQASVCPRESSFYLLTHSLGGFYFTYPFCSNVILYWSWNLGLIFTRELCFHRYQSLKDEDLLGFNSKSRTKFILSCIVKASTDLGGKYENIKIFFVSIYLSSTFRGD